MRRWGMENPRRQGEALGDEKRINKGKKGEIKYE
jgi:hypothetical protein